ncbi:hypothetical protein EV560_11546 [Bosea sp. BK604]|nr:hypothetical protein EV560_11546 [Bosea sp. BK604]
MEEWRRDLLAFFVRSPKRRGRLETTYGRGNEDAARA